MVNNNKKKTKKTSTTGKTIVVFKRLNLKNIWTVFNPKLKNNILKWIFSGRYSHHILHLAANHCLTNSGREPFGGLFKTCHLDIKIPISSNYRRKSSELRKNNSNLLCKKKITFKKSICFKLFPKKVIWIRTQFTFGKQLTILFSKIC